MEKNPTNGKTTGMSLDELIRQAKDAAVLAEAGFVSETEGLADLLDKLVEELEFRTGRRPCRNCGGRGWVPIPGRPKSTAVCACRLVVPTGLLTDEGIMRLLKALSDLSIEYDMETGLSYHIDSARQRMIELVRRWARGEI